MTFLGKDKRYSSAKALIESGHIRSFREIFDHIPKTVVYQDLQVNFKRFSKAILDPSKLTIGELRTLAEMFEYDPKKLLDMAYEQTLTVKQRPAKKKT
jgi:hypothetical protein